MSLDDGLLHFWQCNDGSGALMDIGPADADLVVTAGDVQYLQPGQFFYSVKLNGDTVNGDAELTATVNHSETEFSVAGWIKGESSAGGGQTAVLFERGDDFRLLWNWNGTMPYQYELSVDIPNHPAALPLSIPDDTEWHFFCVRANGANFTAQLDHAFDAETTIGSVGSSTSIRFRDPAIDAAVTLIDQLRYWDRELSDVEVEELRVSPFSPATAELLAESQAPVVSPLSAELAVEPLPLSASAIPTVELTATAGSADPPPVMAAVVTMSAPSIPDIVPTAELATAGETVEPARLMTAELTASPGTFKAELDTAVLATIVEPVSAVPLTTEVLTVTASAEPGGLMTASMAVVTRRLINVKFESVKLTSETLQTAGIV